MSREPRQLLLKPRPLRTAFLVAPAAFPGPLLDDLLDGILRNAHSRWMGRLSPVVFVNNGAIDEPSWEILRQFEPDHIVCPSPLPTALVAEIDEKLRPIRLAVREDEALKPPFSSFETSGVQMPPTPAMLEALRESRLLLLELAKSHDPVCARFLHRNFGCFEQWFDQKDRLRHNMWLEESLKKLELWRVPVTDRASVAGFLHAAAGSRFLKETLPWVPATPFAAPCEFACSGRHHVFLRGHLDHNYQVVVGDTPEDFSEHWNGPVWTGNDATPYKNQLWLPLELAEAPELADALNGWLARQTNWGNSNSRHVVFSSSSVDAGRLKVIGQKLCDGLARLPFHVESGPAPQLKNRQRCFERMHPSLPWNGSETDVFRRVLHGQRGTVEVPEPAVMGHTRKVHGTWAVDVQISHDAEHQLFSNVEAPWLLPAHRGAKFCHFVFRKHGRIARPGIFALEQERSAHPGNRSGKPELDVQLMPEADVACVLLLRSESNWSDTSDPRSKLKATPFLEKTRFSDKGQLFLGLVSLLSSPRDAEQLLERVFWRRLFREMASMDPGRDERLAGRALNVLRKELQAEKIESAKLEKVARRLASLVEGRVQPPSRTLRECERLRLSIPKPAESSEDFKRGSSGYIVGGPRPVTRAEMIEGLDWLVERNVVHLGVDLTCPDCGQSAWHRLDQLEQVTDCPGCEARIPVPVNTQGSMVLNSLARMAVTQGVVGVVQVLNGFRREARSSFFYAPSLELYRSGDKRPWHEIDLLCVVDGELAIVEVKEGRVKASDIDELVEIAKALRPDRAIIAVDRKEWNATRDAELARHAKELAKIGVSLEMHHIVAY